MTKKTLTQLTATRAVFGDLKNALAQFSSDDDLDAYVRLEFDFTEDYKKNPKRSELPPTFADLSINYNRKTHTTFDADGGDNAVGRKAIRNRTER